jgi:hypothetical protein
MTLFGCEATFQGKINIKCLLLLPTLTTITQPLTEMSIRSRKRMFLESRERPVCGADNLIAICEPTV